MIRTPQKLRACLALGLPIALLGACALSPAPVDRYFRLGGASLEKSFASPRLTGTLRVKRPRAEALTDGTHLLYRRQDNPGEVFREPYQLWTDAPSVMLRDVLLQAFQDAKLADRVLGQSLGTPVDYTLASRLVKLERLLEGTGERVTVEIEFSLVRERDRSLIFHGSYAVADQSISGGAPAAVEAYDRALTQIVKLLIQDLDQQLPREVAGLPEWPR